MPSIDDIFKEQFTAIDAMLMQGSLKDAYTATLNILQIDPYNSKAQKYKSKIEKSIKEHNDEFADKQLDGIKEMQKNGQIKEALLKIEELVKVMPENKKLVDALINAQKEYRKVQEKSKNKEIDEIALQLKKFIDESELDKALATCSQLLEKNPKDSQVIELCKKARRIVIDKRLEAKKSLFESNKYEDILNFLYGLKTIEPSYQVLEKLIRKYSAKLYEKQMDEKKDFILKAKEDINYLYQMGKFEECVKAANELLRTDPKSSFAKRMVDKAGEKFDSKVHKELLSQMDEHKLQVDPSNKDGYIKL